MSGKYQLREYQASDREGIFALFREVWDERTAGNARRVWDWKYDANPFNLPGGPLVVVLECEGAIVGTVGGIATRFQVNGQTRPAAWAADNQVHPGHRGKGLRILQYGREQLDALQVMSLGTPNPAAYRFAMGIGFLDLCSFTRYQAVLNPGALLPARPGFRAAARLCHAAYRGLSPLLLLGRDSPHGKGISVSRISGFDGRFTAFWEQVSREYPTIMVRDEAFLDWRFVRCPNRVYRIHAAERRGELAGYIVTRIQQKRDVRIGHIVDVLVRRGDDRALGALVAAAVDDLAKRGADCMLCFLASSQDMHAKVLRRNGFFFRRAGPHVTSAGGRMRESLAAASDWFVTRADSDVDVAAWEPDEPADEPQED